MANKTPFNLVAGHPALDFVNSLDDRFLPGGQLETLAKYGDLLRFTVQTALVSEAEAKAVRAGMDDVQGRGVLKLARGFRESLAKLMYAAVDDRQLRAVPSRLPVVEDESGLYRPDNEVLLINDVVKAAWSVRHLAWVETRFEWRWSKVDAELPLWKLAISASELLAEDLGRVGCCDNPACRWLFLSAGKKQTRRWCEMKVCGNRMKAQRHYARGSGDR